MMPSERGTVLQTDSFPPAHVCVDGNTLQLSSSFSPYSTKYAQHTLLSKYVSSPPSLVPFCIPVLPCSLSHVTAGSCSVMWHVNCPAQSPLSQCSVTWFEFLWWAWYKNTPSFSITKQPGLVSEQLAPLV